jgi:hypothetical protein
MVLTANAAAPTARLLGPEEACTPKPFVRLDVRDRLDRLAWHYGYSATDDGPQACG